MTDSLDVIGSSDILNASILIVDDQVAHSSLLEQILSGAGYQSITSTNDPNEVCELHRKNQYPLILLDLQMPGLDGFQLMEDLKAVETGGYLPVLVLTAQPDNKLRALKAGAMDFVSKPFELNEVLTRVHNILHVRLLHRYAERRREDAENSEARCRSLFNAANDAIVTIYNGVFVESNQKGLELFGVGRDQFLGQSLEDFSPTTQPDGSNSQEVAQRSFQLALNGRHQFFEWTLKGAEGTPAYVDVSISRFEIQGDPYLLALIRDITERKRAEEKICEQAALLDKARDAIIVRDFEGTILFWNKGAERLYGWTSKEVLSRNINDIIYANPDEFEKLNKLIVDNGEATLELREITKDKREITVETRWTLIYDDKGEPKAVFAINTDVTEKKSLEAQFMRAQRMESIGTLASGIAHDLNNILAPILMSIDLLKDTAVDQQAVKILDTIEISAKRGADIVRQVLSFARGLEGKRIAVQAKHLLHDIESIIRDTFTKDISLHFNVPNETWVILGDPTQIHQILMNLCVNARDAMPNGGSLTVNVENCTIDEHYAAMNVHAKAGNYVQIDVTDSGTGIPPALVGKIFEPFFTTKDIHKGTGLGLSTVMAIVKSHDGFIDVYSETGKGTTFKIYLPAMLAPAQVEGKLSETINFPRGNGEMILVADDEGSILTITTQTLHAFGYRVLTATDGAEAVAIYAEHKHEIAVVLTDMTMPFMDGPATIYALRRLNPDVKIIAASGLSTNEGATHSSETNVEYFLTKPYTAGALLKMMRQVLD